MLSAHRRVFLILAGFFCTLMLVACDGQAPSDPVVTRTSLAAETPTLSSATVTSLPPTVTPMPTATLTTLPLTFTPTPTVTVTPTPIWAWQPAGKTICPILLYHRIAEPKSEGSPDARYYVAPSDFEAQMQALQSWGYTSIPISLLVDAITKGASLPPRPIVITFDDGDISVSETAFPIMQRYGFTGVVYIVANRLEADGYMNTAQIKELAAAGWEVGSHGMTHVDLRLNHERLWQEGRESLLVLQRATGAPVNTFAYPFGQIDEQVVNHIAKDGYRAAVGLGSSWVHAGDTLYYLSRIEVRNGTNPEAFAGQLP